MSLNLQEHLRWEKAHIVGHSMGGMAAMKLAAMVPARVSSLSVISSTGGGWQSVPSTWRAVRYAWRVTALSAFFLRRQVVTQHHILLAISMSVFTNRFLPDSLYCIL